MAASVTVSKPTLITTPVSNFSARVRHVIYQKGLESQFDFQSPALLGGMKSPEYLKLNPYGKIPLLILPDGSAYPESEVIVQYTLEKYHDVGPSLTARTPELRAHAVLATRVHDLYVGPIQGCMYKKMDADVRASQLADLVAQLNVLEGLVVGPYVCGQDMTTADSAWAPTFAFITFILHSVFKWRDVFAGRPRLRVWWEKMKDDPVTKRMLDEVFGGLQGWKANNRWRDLGIEDQIASGSYKLTY